MHNYFSIGIPAYKAKYLKECIDSILTQTYTDFELIIVNDASPENVEAIVQQYSDQRIKYYVNAQNFGAEHVVDNYNKCLSYATGSYFILMGDDDKMEPNYLDEFIKLIEKYPGLNVYHCRSYIINENSQKVDLTRSWPEFETIYDNIWHRINGHRDLFIADFVYNRESLVAQGGFYNLPLGWATDDISAYIAMENKGIAHTNIPLLNYRVNAQTISSSGNEKLKFKAALLEEKWILSFLEERLPEEDIDKIIHSSICKNISSSFYKRKQIIVVRSLKKHFFKNLFFWIRNSKKNGISKKMLCKAIYKCFTQNIF